MLATRLAVAIPAVAEQLLAELTKDRVVEKDRDKEAVVEVKVQELTVETIDTFREDLADRAVYLNKLSQDELNTVTGSLVEVQRRAEMSNTASPGASQFVDEQWQSLQARLEADVARQRDALSLVKMDSAAPVAVDFLKEQQALTQALDTDYPSTVGPDRGAEGSRQPARSAARRATAGVDLGEIPLPSRHSSSNTAS